MAEFINTIDVLGDDAVIDSIINRSITEFKDDQITTIGAHAFRSCDALKAINLPALKSTAEYAFMDCSSLVDVSLPSVENFSSMEFRNCKSLEEIDLPKVKNTGYWTFNGCSALKRANFPSATLANQHSLTSKLLGKLDFPVLQTIHMGAFAGSGLKALVIRYDGVCSLADTTAFNGTPIASGTGYIYVPRALIEDYKVATNWSVYADQFRALEDYTVDGTTTGELDETKI